MQKRPHSAESGYSSSDDNSNFLPDVQGISRLSLEDGGFRNWQEQAITMLNNFYPDWKNPVSSIMVPASFCLGNHNDKGRLTEKNIFDLLENFGQKYKEPMFVVHSHNFKELCTSIRSGDSKNKKWVMGEHDFVIIHKHYGVIFLQVKACDCKNWSKAFKEAQSQVKKDQESLKIFLEKQFKTTARKSSRKFRVFKYPGFIVMPNCKRPEETALEIENGIFKEDCNSLESFHSWWLKKVANPGEEDDPDIYERLVVRFVALRHFDPPLKETIDHSYRQIAKYHTPQQLEILMRSSPKQWISGPAGSGKTVLLIDKVLELGKRIEEAGRDERILVLVFNRPLRDYLYQILKGDKIEIMTFMQFLYNKQIIPEGLFFEKKYSYKQKCNVIESFYRKLQLRPPTVQDKYEHIFVDEGQDLFNEHWPELLKLFHNEPDNDPLRAFYFWVMFDSNQQVQPGMKQLPHKHLKDASRLTHVLRNTGNVFDLSKKYFTSVYKEDEEIRLGHTEAGLNIHWVDKLQEDKSNRNSLLFEQIMKLKSQGIENKDIVVLTRTEKERDKVTNDLVEKPYKYLQCQNAENFIQIKSDKIIVESIRRFKGLESKVVILLDPEYRVDQQAVELMYVAVSRCHCYLVIISLKSRCEWFKSGLSNLNFPPEVESKEETSSLQLEAMFDYDD